MHNKKCVLPLHAVLFYPWNWQVSWHSSPVRTPKNTSITLSLEHQSLTHLLNDPLTCLGRSGHPCGHSWHQAAAGSLLQLRLQHVAAWLLPPFGQIEHISEFLLDHFRSHQIKGATGEQWPIVKPFQRGSPSKDFKMQSCVFQATSKSPWCPESARPCGLLLLGSPTEGWQAKQVPVTKMIKHYLEPWWGGTKLRLSRIKSTDILLWPKITTLLLFR